MTAFPLQQDLATIAARLELAIPEQKPRDAQVRTKSKQRLHPAVRQAATAALNSFRASPEYGAVIADLPTMNMHQLQFWLRASIEGPHFAPLLALMRQPESLDIDLDDFVPSAISLGVLVQAVLVLGLSGSIGYVMNVDPKSPKSGLYVGGAFDAGIDAGIEGDVCLGFWHDAVDDLGGVYIGEEVDIDDGTGLVEAAFEKDEELALLFIGIDLGIDDGMENTDYYFFEFDVGGSPIYQPGDSTYLVQLLEMTCNNSKDDYDSIYFEFLQDSGSTVYRFPEWDSYAMCEQHRNNILCRWSVGLIIKFDTSFALRLHIGDQTASDVTITASDFAGVGDQCTVNWNLDIASNGVNYSLQMVLLKG